jgi:chaperonin cofactor prefoldin
MTDRAALEQTVAELQRVSQQLATLQAQVQEIEGTLNHLSTQDSSRAIYQQVGPLLVEVEDAEALQTSLAATRDQIAEAVGILEGREQELRISYETAMKQFEAS